MGMDAAGAGNGQARPRIVVYVEDNAINVRLMDRILAQRPAVTLLSAGRGGEGLALARERRPDVLLVDLHLPDMSGEDFLRAVVTDPLLTRTPVVIVSGVADSAAVERLLALGACAFVVKPIVIDEFLAVIDDCLGGEIAR
jgi:CheY-like chemotaxis protein